MLLQSEALLYGMLLG